MYLLLIQVLCLECHSVQLLQEETSKEAVIESLIGLLLYDFLGEVAIDEVRLTHIPASSDQDAHYWLQVRATGLNEELAMPIPLLEARLEEAICCALLEHFHIVVIDTVEIRQKRDDAQSTAHE